MPPSDEEAATREGAALAAPYRADGPGAADRQSLERSPTRSPPAGAARAWSTGARRAPPTRRAAIAGEGYWARPVPGFGDPAARLVVVGLAPAAHGANRTGRMFTGDRSGEWLYAALHRAGYANQPTSERRGDGLRLRDAWITAVVRCAPPANQPTPVERDECLPWLAERAARCSSGRGCCWRSARSPGTGRCGAARRSGTRRRGPRPRFGHGAEAEVGPYTLLGCYHPSQQNTFTGKLTREMLDAVFARARGLARLSATGDT